VFRVAVSPRSASGRQVARTDATSAVFPRQRAFSRNWLRLRCFWQTESGRCEADTEFSSQSLVPSRSTESMQPPFTTFPTVTDSGVSVCQSGDPTCGGTCVPPGSGLCGHDPHIRTSYMQQYNLTLQHDSALASSWSGMSERWAASCSIFGSEPTVCCSGERQPPSETNLEQRRPSRDSVTFSNRKAGKFELQRLLPTSTSVFPNGFTFLTGYTWSKCIDQLRSPLRRWLCDGSFVPQMSTTWRLSEALRVDVPHRSRSVARSSCLFGYGKRFLKQKGSRTS